MHWFTYQFTLNWLSWSIFFNFQIFLTMFSSSFFNNKFFFRHDHKTHYSHSKTFVPLVTRLPAVYNGPMIPNLYMNLLSPFLTFDHDQDAKGMSSTGMDVNSPVSDCALPNGANAKTSHDHILSEVKFYVIDGRGVKIEFEEISISGKNKQLHIVVCWPQSSIEKYGKSLFMALPEVHKSNFFFAKRPPNSISLYACLDAFLKEEPLGPEDMWWVLHCFFCMKSCIDELSCMYSEFWLLTLLFAGIVPLVRFISKQAKS